MVVQRHLVTIRQERASGSDYWRAVCTCGAEAPSPVRTWDEAQAQRLGFQRAGHGKTRRS